MNRLSTILRSNTMRLALLSALLAGCASPGPSALIVGGGERALRRARMSGLITELHLRCDADNLPAQMISAARLAYYRQIEAELMANEG